MQFDVVLSQFQKISDNLNNGNNYLTTSTHVSLTTFLTHLAYTTAACESLTNALDDSSNCMRQHFSSGNLMNSINQIKVESDTIKTTIYTFLITAYKALYENPLATIANIDSTKKIMKALLNKLDGLKHHIDQIDQYDASMKLLLLKNSMTEGIDNDAHLKAGSIDDDVSDTESIPEPPPSDTSSCTNSSRSPDTPTPVINVYVSGNQNHISVKVTENRRKPTDTTQDRTPVDTRRSKRKAGGTNNRTSKRQRIAATKPQTGDPSLRERLSTLNTSTTVPLRESIDSTKTVSTLVLDSQASKEVTTYLSKLLNCTKINERSKVHILKNFWNESKSSFNQLPYVIFQESEVAEIEIIKNILKENYGLVIDSAEANAFNTLCYCYYQIRKFYDENLDKTTLNMFSSDDKINPTNDSYINKIQTLLACCQEETSTLFLKHLIYQLVCLQFITALEAKRSNSLKIIPLLDQFNDYVQDHTFEYNIFSSRESIGNCKIYEEALLIVSKQISHIDDKLPSYLLSHVLALKAGIAFDQGDLSAADKCIQSAELHFERGKRSSITSAVEHYNFTENWIDSLGRRIADLKSTT